MKVTKTQLTCLLSQTCRISGSNAAIQFQQQVSNKSLSKEDVFIYQVRELHTGCGLCEAERTTEMFISVSGVRVKQVLVVIYLFILHILHSTLRVLFKRRNDYCLFYIYYTFKNQSWCV